MNVYGHGQPADLGSISSELALAVAKSGAKLVDLQVGSAASEKALVREVQWDTFGKEVLHLDLMRVDAEARIRVDVPLHCKGTAPGVLAGGLLEQPLHHISIECLAVLIPDEIPVKVGNLQVGQAIHVNELVDIPEGVKVLTPGELLVVHVVTPKAAPAEPAAVEPAAAAGTKK